MTGQDILDRTSWTGHLGPDNWDRLAKTGRRGQVSLIGNLERTENTVQQGHDNVWKTYIFAKILDFHKMFTKTKIFINTFSKMFVIPIFSQNVWIFAKISETKFFAKILNFPENVFENESLP